MLYDRWKSIAKSNARQLALLDAPSGRRWTFAELFEWAERGGLESGRVRYPRGVGPEFVAEVLQAWRSGGVVVPLEKGQAQPVVEGNLPAEVVHLKTTSATTQAPRMIAFTARQLAADADNIMSTMGLRPDWPNVAAISMAHSYGFSNLVLPLLLHGVPLILAGSGLPESVRQALLAVPQTTLAGVPALWRTWFESGLLPGSVRLAISAGAPLTVQLEESIWAETGIKVHNFYGSSECGGIAYDRSGRPRADGSLVGTPMENVQVNREEDGSLTVEGEAVGLGYWPEEDGRLQQGVYQTGDLGEILEGKIHLRGRACDQINVAGRKVSPEFVERQLASHLHVEDCLVFGVPNGEARNEMIVACVVASPAANGDSLRRYLGQSVPPWQLPREWWFVDSLEVNQRGKLSRADWRQRYLERQKATGANSTTADRSASDSHPERVDRRHGRSPQPG
jgi:acyl-coenzyme A synthetase/AMP-(fatty) acid ligase